MGSPDMGDFPETAEQHELVVDNRIQEGDQEEEEKEEKEEKRIGAEEKEEDEEEEGEKREADKGEDTEQEEGLLDNYDLVPFSEDPPNTEVIPFEDFQKVLASLNGAAAIASQVRAQRDALLGNFECLLKMRKQSLSRINDLEVLKQRLKSKDLRLENAKVSLQEKSEDVAITKDRLLPSVRSLLAAAKALAIRCNHLQEKHRSLEGEGGYGKLLHIQSMLAARQRHMISQIAALYPIAPCPATEKVPTPTTTPLQSRLLINAVSSNSDSLARESQSVDRRDILPMKIGGLRVVAPLNNRSGLYTEPNDHESSATALGYVAHSLALLAACLDVPLRYPIRLGASRSYIQDHAPIVEPNEPATANIGLTPGGAQKTFVEFPLFTEGQDSTRSAYAVFLLNKDLEQVLNYLGAESVGPRHTLPNLNKIIKLVCSGACATT